MDRHAFPPSLRDHLPSYAPPVAALSRIISPLIRALPAGHRVEMLRPGHLTLTTNLGEVRIRMDLAAQPALESIALDPDPARRVALVNLYLRELLETLKRHTGDYGIHTLTIADFVPVDDRVAVAVDVAQGLSIACRLPHIVNGLSQNDESGPNGNFSKNNESRWDRSFHCIVEMLSPTLVDALSVPSAAEAPTPEALLSALHGIPIQTRLRLTSRRFTCATLRTLQHGDVLLGWPWQRDVVRCVDTRQNNRPGDGQRIGAHWFWGTAGHVQGRYPASIEGNYIHIIGMPDMNDDRIDLPHSNFEAGDLDLKTPGAFLNRHEGHAADAVDASGGYPGQENPEQTQTEDTVAPDTSILDGVDLLVHVEIGCIPMAAADLARVRSGTILTLPENISQATVNLVVSGRTIATGELVVVGDQLGVRVHRNGNANG
jgi:type III secretion protein Q